MEAGILVGVLAFSPSAFAQEQSGGIAERIESTFNLVINNARELAIPLTRRALARRSIEDNKDQQAEVQPLPYSGSGVAPLDAGESDIASDESVDVAAVDPEDPDIARLPRPRPAQEGDVEAQGDSSDGEADVNDPGAVAADDTSPLDLVAGAPAPPVEVAVPSGPPVDLVSAPGPVELASAPQPVEVAAAPAPAAPATAEPTGALPPILPAPTGAPVRELVATGSCLSPNDVEDKDGDFKRNAEVLSGSLFCIAEQKFDERKHKWTVQSVRSSRPGPLWVVMHDDEDMSFDSAVEALKTYGGTLATVDTGGRRNMDGIDPNRNLSADGIGCSKLGTDATPEFTAFFSNLFTKEPIIALHNNSGGKVATGGLGHVSMESLPKDMEAFAAADQKGPLAGDRSLVLLVAPVSVTATAEARAKALSARGINALIENVDKKKGDCSLSNYAVLTGHGDYLNITVDAGERDKQRKIIDVIMAGRNDTVATQ